MLCGQYSSLYPSEDAIDRVVVKLYCSSPPVICTGGTKSFFTNVVQKTFSNAQNAYPVELFYESYGASNSCAPAYCVLSPSKQNNFVASCMTMIVNNPPDAISNHPATYAIKGGSYWNISQPPFPVAYW